MLLCYDRIFSFYYHELDIIISDTFVCLFFCFCFFFFFFFFFVMQHQLVVSVLLIDTPNATVAKNTDLIFKQSQLLLVAKK